MAQQNVSIVFSDVNPTIQLSGLTELNFDEVCIQESLNAIWSTPLRTRPFRRAFGCRLIDLLFEPMDSITATRIGSELKNAAEKWEPRIQNIQIEVGINLAEQEYYVTCSYQIPLLNNKVVNYAFSIPVKR